jgi:hypothetical protein
MNAGYIILVLKIAVALVTALLAASFVALARGNYRLHGRINHVVFALTMVALLGLEVIARLLQPDLFAQYLEEQQATQALRIHLGFSLPAAGLLCLMLATGRMHRRRIHIGLGIVFLALWTGTFITGIFYLPHELP